MKKPKKLNPIQQNYLQNLKLLSALKLPLDLFDNLYKVNFSKKQ